MKSARISDWKNEPLPSRFATLTVSREYDAAEMRAIRRGSIPEGMEDKWFIHHRRGVLYLHRSWTGYCIYRAHLKRTGAGWTLTHAEVNRSPEQYKETDDRLDRELLLYLIDVVLLHREREYPERTDADDGSIIKAWSFAGCALLAGKGDPDPEAPDEQVAPGPDGGQSLPPAGVRSVTG